MSKNLPEARVAACMPKIERALAQALKDAAGEPMAYILFIAPVGRVGEHIVGSNIAEKDTIVHFLRDAADIVDAGQRRTHEYAEELVRRGTH